LSLQPQEPKPLVAGPDAVVAALPSVRRTPLLPRNGLLGQLTGPWFALIVALLFVAASVDFGGFLESTVQSLARRIAPEHPAITGEYLQACLFLGLTTLLAFNRLMMSIRCGVFLVVALAIAAICGTFVESIHDTATAQGQVYHSWWFISLMILMAINLNAASWPRYFGVFRLPRMRPLRHGPESFRSLPETREIDGLSTATDPDRIQETLSQQIGLVTAQTAEKGTALFAQRGLIQRWGFIITHVGMTLLLAGGVYLSLGAHFGGPPAASQIWLAEGLWRDWYWTPIKNSDMSRRESLPFAVRLHDFDADFFGETQVPRFFGSRIEIRDTGGNTSIREITMNEASRWRGWKMSQNSYMVLDRDLEIDDARLLASMDGEMFLQLLERGRMAVRLVDNRTQREYPIFDVGAGCRVRVPQSDFEFATPDGFHFALMRDAVPVAEGTIDNPASAIRLDSAAAGELDGAVWAARIDGLYPNYARTEEGDATEGAQMENPAVRWTLLSSGRVVGQDLAFHRAEFRDMSFAELPVQARFVGFDPPDLTSWEPGQPIQVHFEFRDTQRGTVIGILPMAIGEIRIIRGQAPRDVTAPTPPDGGDAVAASSSRTGKAPFSATLVGHLPAAYSVLTIMRESQSLKLFFYLSFFLFLSGPILAFSAAHLQIWAWVDASGRRVRLGGRARGRRTALTKVLDRLAGEISKEIPEKSS
jgi:hypothetical protein